MALQAALDAASPVVWEYLPSFRLVPYILNDDVWWGANVGVFDFFGTDAGTGATPIITTGNVGANASAIFNAGTVISKVLVSVGDYENYADADGMDINIALIEIDNATLFTGTGDYTKVEVATLDYTNVHTARYQTDSQEFDIADHTVANDSYLFVYVRPKKAAAGNFANSIRPSMKIALEVQH